jgi:hypothetical protein
LIIFQQSEDVDVDDGDSDSVKINGEIWAAENGKTLALSQNSSERYGIIVQQ